MNTVSILLWVALPYAAAATFVVGHIWRYRYDQFGWTTRSSQTYENRLLRWGSPMFHFGMFAVIAGHAMGLLIPAEWLFAIGITEGMYHFVATWLGTVAAIVTLAGLIILIYRRRKIGPVFLATTRMDKLMYIFLAGAIVLGSISTIQTQVFGGGYNYRETISPWFRSLFILQPQPGLMEGVPLLYQLHVITATLLFALWPFTRLVHVFSVPIWYLFRPYIVYRSRDDARTPGSRPVKRGWEGIQTPDPKKLTRL